MSFEKSETFCGSDFFSQKLLYPTYHTYTYSMVDGTALESFVRHKMTYHFVHSWKNLIVLLLKWNYSFKWNKATVHGNYYVIVLEMIVSSLQRERFRVKNENRMRIAFTLWAVSLEISDFEFSVRVGELVKNV